MCCCHSSLQQSALCVVRPLALTSGGEARKGGGTGQSASKSAALHRNRMDIRCVGSFVVVHVGVCVDTGYAYSISVTPRHLRPAVRSERMRNSSLGHKWMWCHSWGSCWWRRGLIICQAVSDMVLWWQCPPVGVYFVISSRFYPVRVGGV